MWQVSKHSLVYEIPGNEPTYVWEYDSKIYFTITAHSDEAEESMINVFSDMEEMYFGKEEKK